MDTREKRKNEDTCKLMSCSVGPKYPPAQVIITKRKTSALSIKEIV